MSADPPEHIRDAEESDAPVVAPESTAAQAGLANGDLAETYRTLFGLSLDGVLLISPDGVIIEANAAAREMFGMTEGELRRARREDLFVIGPDYAEHAAERERSGRTAGEATFIRKDGTRFPVDFTSILPGGTGGHGHGLVTFREITRRKTTETSLRESEERFRRAVTQTKAGYFLVDREGRFAEVNAAWLKIHGFDSADEVIGRHFSLTQVEDDLELSQRIVETMLAGASVPDGEFSHRRRDGSVGYHTFTLSPVTKQGEVVGLEGFMIDLTERRKAEQTLRVISTRLELALRSANAGTWDWHIASGNIDWSQEMFELFGLDSRTTVASFEAWRAVLHPEDLVASERRIAEALAQQTSLDSDYRIVLPNGEVRWINALGEGIYDDQGRPVKMIGICWDITERKWVEEALRQSERDLLEAQELAHIGSYALDLRTQQLTWSDEMFRVWGLDRRQGAPRESIRQLVRPSDYERISQAALEAIEHGTAYELEFRIRRPDGAERTIVTTGRTDSDASGKVVVLKGTHQDITELRQAEEGYRTLFHEMLDGFALHEIICADGAPVDYRFLAVNPAFERMTGLKAEDIVGRTVLEVLPATERYWIEIYGDVALTGRPAFFENYHSQLDRHFHVTAYQPSLGQFACMFADITERKRAEDALRKSEAKIRGILDNIRVGVTLISPQMEILELNPLMREWFPHVDPGQAPICYRAINKPPRETPCDDCPTIATLHDGKVHETTQETRVSGSPRKFRVVSSPIFDASGKVSAAIEMVEDVTERLALEVQLQQAPEDGVGRAAGRRRGPRLQQHAGGHPRAHARWPWSRPTQRQPLHARPQEIQKAAERSADLTRQLLAFARKQTIAPKVLDLNETVAGMLKMLRAADRRGHRPGLAARRGSVAGEDGPLPDRPDPDQPLRQRPRRHRRRRQDHHRDGQRALSMTPTAPPPGLGAGRVCGSWR